MKRIGVIGAGIMASGMVQNFLKHEYEVFVWNRSPKRLQPLIEAGAKDLESPKAVAEAADIVIECVTDDEASRTVWLSQQGILFGASPDKVLIASSSLSLKWTDELAALCKERNFQFLDMPLTGSRIAAEEGTLRLLIGGEREIVEAIWHDLEAVAEKIYHFGPAGAGMRFKLILNSLMAIHMNAAAQAKALAEKAGIDGDVLAHALFDGNMGPASPATKLLFDSPGWEEGHVNFALQWMEKDLRYARQMARLYGIDFDLLNATQDDYARAKDKGYASADVTAIRRLFEK